MVNNPDNGSHAMHEKEKRIIIVVRCVFTLQGLSALCHSAHWRVQAITPEAFDAYTVLNDQRPDLLIIESECFDEQRSQALTVMNVLPHKTIVLTNSYSGGLCKVPSAGGTTIMVDKSGSVMALKWLLQRTANERHSVQPGPVAFDTTGPEWRNVKFSVLCSTVTVPMRLLKEWVSPIRPLAAIKCPPCAVLASERLMKLLSETTKDC